MRTPDRILRDSKSIAVVGISASPERDSHRVARYLREHGYQINPVNPELDEVLGLKCYPSLRDVPEPVDVVDVFRRSEHLVPIAQDAVAIKAKVLWLQLGIMNDAARELAEHAGLDVVMDQCTMALHMRLIARR